MMDDVRQKIGVYARRHNRAFEAHIIHTIQKGSLVKRLFIHLIEQNQTVN